MAEDVLGLRSGEVTFLELDDIDWKLGKLSVRGKSGQRSDLPLSTEVGKAIAAYLRHGRPQSTSRRVFLRAKAPIRGFLGQSGVGSIVRHRLLRAGLDAPTFGAHHHDVAWFDVPMNQLLLVHRCQTGGDLHRNFQR